MAERYPSAFQEGSRKTKMQNKEIEDGNLNANHGRQTTSYLLKTVFLLSFIKSQQDNTLKKAY